MEFIHGTTLVHLKIRCWSGEKKASRDRDINLGKDGKLPPKELLDLGRKKIFPTKALDPLTRERKAAERACLAEGTRFMGGYAVPDEAIDELEVKLMGFKSKFESAQQIMLKDFEKTKETFITENSEFAHIFRDQIPDLETVSRAFEFSYKLYKLQPLEGHEPDENEVADQILHEIGMSCKTVSRSLLDRKTSISGDKLQEQFEPFIKKLDTLSFGNGRLLKVLDEFKSMQLSVPAEPIDKDHPFFGLAVTFLSMCSDSDKLERIIDGQLSVTAMINDIQKPRFNASQGQTEQAPLVTPVITQAASQSGAYF